jgi:hypothetical protein
VGAAGHLARGDAAAHLRPREGGEGAACRRDGGAALGCSGPPCAAALTRPAPLTLCRPSLPRPPPLACQANKAANLLEHNAEIAARPARTWFLSNRQKLLLQSDSKQHEPTSARAAHAERPSKDKRPAATKADADRPERKLTRKQKRKREADRGLAEQTGMDPDAIRRQNMVAAKGYKSLAKRSPAQAEQALKAAAAAAKPKAKKQRAESPRAAPADGGEAGGRGKAPKPFRRSNHSKTTHKKRR